MRRIEIIGLFTVLGVGAIIGFSLFVNDTPYWYRHCNEVKIHVDDATGLRRKSPVKTLGLDIGWIRSVDLDGDRVLIRVCVTGPVRLNADTRAYIRSSGFLGDKFLELKPMDRIGDNGAVVPGSPDTSKPASPPDEKEKLPDSSSASDQLTPFISAAPGQDGVREIREIKLQNPDQQDTQLPATDPSEERPAKAALIHAFNSIANWLEPSAFAEEATLNASREAELQDTIKKVGKLIDQLTLMVGDLREVTQQQEFKDTVVNLNNSMKHLELLLRPTGKVMKNVDSAMESLKNTMASAETVMAKIQNGEGSIGKLVNDPTIYDDLRSAIQSINLLLGKAGKLRVFVDIGAWQIPAYDGARASFKLMIAPNPGRYYLLGISNDPRGLSRITTTTTTINGATPSVMVQDVNEQRGLRLTAMFGKFFGPLDLTVGLLEDYGAIGAGYWFDEARRFGVHIDAYSLGKDQPFTVRAYGRAQVWSAVYVVAGVDQVQKFNGRTTSFFGGGLFFDDDDLKYLLAFR